MAQPPWSKLTARAYVSRRGRSAGPSRSCRLAAASLDSLRVGITRLSCHRADNRTLTLDNLFHRDVRHRRFASGREVLLSGLQPGLAIPSDFGLEALKSVATARFETPMSTPRRCAGSDFVPTHYGRCCHVARLGPASVERTSALPAPDSPPEPALLAARRPLRTRPVGTTTWATPPDRSSIHNIRGPCLPRLAGRAQPGSAHERPNRSARSRSIESEGRMPVPDPLRCRAICTVSRCRGAAVFS